MPVCVPVPTCVSLAFVCHHLPLPACVYLCLPACHLLPAATTCCLLHFPALPPACLCACCLACLPLCVLWVLWPDIYTLYFVLHIPATFALPAPCLPALAYTHTPAHTCLALCLLIPPYQTCYLPALPYLQGGGMPACFLYLWASTLLPVCYLLIDSDYRCSTTTVHALQTVHCTPLGGTLLILLMMCVGETPHYYLCGVVHLTNLPACCLPAYTLVDYHSLSLTCCALFAIYVMPSFWLVALVLSRWHTFTDSPLPDHYSVVRNVI